MPFSTLTCVGAIKCERIPTTCGAPATPATARAAAVSNSMDPGTMVSEEIASTSAEGGAPSSCSSNVRARADSNVGRSKPPACSAPGACGANGSARRRIPNQAPITARRWAYMKAPSRSNGGSRRTATTTDPLPNVRRETPGVLPRAPLTVFAQCHRGLVATAPCRAHQSPNRRRYDPRAPNLHAYLRRAAGQQSQR